MTIKETDIRKKKKNRHSGSFRPDISGNTEWTDAMASDLFGTNHVNHPSLKKAARHKRLVSNPYPVLRND